MLNNSMARTIQYSPSRSYGNCRSNKRIYIGGEFPWQMGAECSVVTPPDPSEFTLYAYDSKVYSDYTEIACGTTVNPLNVSSAYILELNYSNESSTDIVISASEFLFESNGIEFVYQYGGAVEVTGAGSSSVNGIYSFQGFRNGRAYYFNAGSNLVLYWEPGFWSISPEIGDVDNVYYKAIATNEQPFEASSWEVGSIGASAVPTFEGLNIWSQVYGPDSTNVEPGTRLYVMLRYAPDDFPSLASLSATASIKRVGGEYCVTDLSFVTDEIIIVPP